MDSIHLPCHPDYLDGIVRNGMIADELRSRRSHQACYFSVLNPAYVETNPTIAKVGENHHMFRSWKTAVPRRDVHLWHGCQHLGTKFYTIVKWSVVYHFDLSSDCFMGVVVRDNTILSKKSESTNPLALMGNGRRSAETHKVKSCTGLVS